MITIDEPRGPRKFPNELIPQLGSYAQRELEEMGSYVDIVYQDSRVWVMWDDDELCGIYGVMREGLIGTCRFWFLLGRGFRPIRHVKRCADLVDYYKDEYPSMYTTVERDFWQGHKFARVCGFYRTALTIMHNGKEHAIYKVKP